MSEPWWEDFKDAIVDGAKQLAKETIGDFLDSAQDDAKAFLESIKDDLERWAKMLKNDEITKDDLKDLIEAKEALAEIRVLTQAGIAATKLERFRTGLINLVTNTAKSMFP